MKTKVWIALLALYIVWGSTYLAIRFAVETIPPFMHASLRFLISGAILWRDPVHLAARGRRPGANSRKLEIHGDRRRGAAARREWFGGVGRAECPFEHCGAHDRDLPVLADLV
jgi:drug/metabolite transporter (DMT)-like permease